MAKHPFEDEEAVETPEYRGPPKKEKCPRCGGKVAKGRCLKCGLEVK